VGNINIVRRPLRPVTILLLLILEYFRFSSLSVMFLAAVIVAHHGRLVRGVSRCQLPRKSLLTDCLDSLNRVSLSVCFPVRIDGCLERTGSPSGTVPQLSFQLLERQSISRC
jgi:hypothetical protein